MKLALVHDWLNQRGGAENVLEVLVEMFPESPVYTSIYDPERMPESYQSWDIRTNWMDRLPAIHSHHQPYLPLYPLAWNNLNLGDYDVILSNKSGFCHGIQNGSALHICYCLAPTRYLWQYEMYVQRENMSAAMMGILRPVINLLRKWDYEAAQRVSAFIAISSDIQGRIARFYDRESAIIYPPVDTERFHAVDHQDDYFLVVSRLIPYKRVDLAVRACTELGLPLKVAGSGRGRERLEAMAGPTIEFLGRVSDENLPGLMAHCRAFLFPGLEDFGIAPVEAQAAGRPVIAFRGGGALDTVLDGVTGVHFKEQTVESLKQALERYETIQFDSERIVEHASTFDRSVFEKQLSDFINRQVEEYGTG